MIKDILVNLSVGPARDVAADFSASVASIFDAHLTGVAFNYDPIIPIGEMYGIASEVIQSQQIENEKAAKVAAAKLDDAARRAAVSAQAHVLGAPVTGAPNLFAHIARRFDLSIVDQPEPDKPVLDRLIVEAALFDSGRPVLVIPYIQRAGLKLDRVMVCWDGSRSAARAVGDAMPFIVRAKTAEIVIVATEPAKSDEMPGADIAHHLARHGAKAEIDRIVSTEIDVASTILSHAADVSADLLVMGGYGHSRLREFVLGGATRGILGAMTVPTLMSH
jgi:nucleotide-binding universal stress UspA family protein